MPGYFVGSEWQSLDIDLPPQDDSSGSAPGLSIWKWLGLWFELLLYSQSHKPMDDYHPPIPASHLWRKF